MAKCVINQYSTSFSEGPSFSDEMLAKTVTVDSNKFLRGGFKTVMVTVAKCNCLLIYNASSTETILISAMNDDEFFEPIPPLTGRYIMTYGEADVNIKTIGA